MATPFSAFVLTRKISEDSFAKYPVSDPSQRLSPRGQSLRDPSPPGGSLQRTRLVPPKILVPRSWYQDPGTKILVPRSWYQDPGTKIVVPRSWYQDLGGGRAHKRLIFCGASRVHQELECNVFREAACLLYTSPSPRDRQKSRMPSSA